MTLANEYIDGGLRTCSASGVVLGIDQSYSGFALTAMAIGGPPDYASWLYHSTGSGAKRVVSIREFLRSIALWLETERFAVEDAVMEGYAPGAKFGRELAGELGGMVKVWLWDMWSIEPYLVAPMSLKKYVTGKGTKVQKNQMLLYTYKKWGAEFHDDNLCDSYGLARLGSGRHELAYEAEIFSKLKR